MLMGEVQIKWYGHSGGRSSAHLFTPGDSGKSYEGLNDYAGLLKDG